MAVLRQAEAARIASQAVVLDLGDLKRQADEMKSHAMAEAARIVQEAQQERVRLLGDAMAVGRAKGLEEGRAQGRAQGIDEGRQLGMAERRAELAQLEAAWAGGLESFVSRREEMLQAAKTDVLRLACEIARRVVKRVVEVDAGVVEGQMEAAIREVSRASRLVIAVSPADHPLALAALPRVLGALGVAGSAELVVDEKLARGACVVRTGAGGEVNAAVQVQLDRIIDAVLPVGGAA